MQKSENSGCIQASRDAVGCEVLGRIWISTFAGNLKNHAKEGGLMRRRQVRGAARQPCAGDESAPIPLSHNLYCSKLWEGQKQTGAADRSGQEIDREAVERRLDPLRQRFDERPVIHRDVEIGEDRALGFHALDPAQSHLEIGVRSVRRDL